MQTFRRVLTAAILLVAIDAAKTAPKPIRAVDEVRILVTGNPDNGCFGQFGEWLVISSSSKTIVVTVTSTINWSDGTKPPTETNQEVRVESKASLRLGCGGNIGAKASWRIVSAHY